MPASDILNTSPTDPLNPDYGWQKKRPTTQSVLKANAGAAYFREITDIGHQFALNWGTTNDSQKLWTDIARLKRYFEQYRDGYFTLVDYEGNGRQFVGRFTTPVEPIPVGHNRWAAQNVIFEEVPGATMLEYPSDWTNESIWRYCLNDFGEVQPAVDDPTNWSLSTNSLDAGGYEITSGVTSAWAQMAYVGWGCQVWAPQEPDRGIAAVYLDGVSQGTIDQYAASPTQSASLMQIQNVVLGIHILQLVVTGTKNSSSSGYTIAFDSLKIMR